MKQNSRALILFVVIALSALLAYLFRETIERTIIQPLVFFFWVLGIYYKYLPQMVIWIILVGVVIWIELAGITGRDTPLGREPELRTQFQGGVESLAGSFRRAPSGAYFKWLLAQRLGKLSREMIAFNARVTPPSGSEALSGPGWDPPNDVASYLEAGLNGSFADYPHPRWWFQRPAPTPLDLDPEKAIDYIESKMEKD